jgi:hypothetical protein
VKAKESQRELIAHIASALDDAVRRGDIDEACRQAKDLSAAAGMPEAAAGRAAIISLVQSVERVLGAQAF